MEDLSDSYLDSIWLSIKWFRINYFIHPGILWGRAYYLHFLEEDNKDDRGVETTIFMCKFRGKFIHVFIHLFI